MIKKLSSMLLMCLFILISVNFAYAFVFMNFESPNFAPDTLYGEIDYFHSYVIPYGTITFNGQIWNKLADANQSDHTTGQGYFLKNTKAKDQLTMNFSFDVLKFDLWLLGTQGTKFYGQAYDINGQSIESEQTWTGDGRWFYESTYPFITPVRSIKLRSGSGLGNNFAVDDITIYPVPEPATLSLFGLGLLGLLGFRKKTK